MMVRKTIVLNPTYPIGFAQSTCDFIEKFFSSGDLRRLESLCPHFGAMLHLKNLLRLWLGLREGLVQLRRTFDAFQLSLLPKGVLGGHVLEVGHLVVGGVHHQVGCRIGLALTIGAFHGDLVFPEVQFDFVDLEDADSTVAKNLGD